MKRLLPLLPLVLGFVSVSLAPLPLRAGEADDFAAVRTTDQRRILATISRDAEKLRDCLSADLRYAQANGHVLGREQYIASVAASSVRYVSVKPADVVFQTVAPGAIAMSGLVEVAVELNGQHAHYTMHFLAVWRDESGHWRLLAYQSGPLPGSG